MVGLSQAISKAIYCPCGVVVRAADEDQLVAQAQRHAREVHGMDLSREQRWRWLARSETLRRAARGGA